MKTLISSRIPPLNIPISSSLYPKITTLHNQKKWKIHSSPKGFTSKSQKNVKKGKVLQTDDFPRKIPASNKSEEGDDKIPDAVFERMIKRILIYTAAPLGIGLAILQAIGIVKENNLMNVPNWLPFLTTFVTFGSSALGIAFGTLSTSWDLEDKGSVLGFDEAKKNWEEIWKEDES